MDCDSKAIIFQHFSVVQDKLHSNCPSIPSGIYRLDTQGETYKCLREEGSYCFALADCVDDFRQ